VRVYLNADKAGLDTLLARAEAAGGKVTLSPVQLPGDMGRFAHIRDSEGNIVGLHEN
jgi:predicted enzyme related to lactoylglutathione lyase